jgi:septum site-determining protein MinD
VLAIQLVGIVPEDEQVTVATNQGVPVVMQSSSRAGTAFINIARRLTGEEVPFENLDGRDGFFGKISRLMKAGGGE